MHTKSLLTGRRFAPLFWTQFLGTFNDSLFKNALVVGVAFGMSEATVSKDFLVNAATGVLILPFFLFSGVAGELADQYDKAALTRRLKVVEVIVMAAGAVGFWFGNLPLLFATLFCMGAQSAFFGPIKYAILPQHLQENELVAGNGLIEAGTFLGVLLGTLAGGLLIAIPGGTFLVSGAALLVAGLGVFASRAIPEAAPAVPAFRADHNPITASIASIRTAKAERPVWLSILALSWFWFFGALLLAQLPLLAKDVLHGDEHTVTWLLAVFSVGVGLGSLGAERLTGGRVELAMVPLAGLGIGLFSWDLGLSAQPADPMTVRVYVDLFCVGVSGGLFAVPLYAVMQKYAPPASRSRVIAANNILNALFMVGAALYAVAVRASGISIPGLIILTATLQLLVTIWTGVVVRKNLIRFIVAVVVRTVYRVRTAGLERIPETGPALLVCNHPSLADPVIVGGLCRRPVRFVMYHKIYKLWFLRWFFDLVGAIPIAPSSEDAVMLDAAFDAIDEALRNGEVVALFPEGGLTRTGEIAPFKPGVERILTRFPVPVLPMALRGMWGSFFGHAGGQPMKKVPKRFWSRIELVAGDLLGPEGVSARGLEAQVAVLRGSNR